MLDPIIGKVKVLPMTQQHIVELAEFFTGVCNHYIISIGVYITKIIQQTVEKSGGGVGIGGGLLKKSLSERLSWKRKTSQKTVPLKTVQIPQRVEFFPKSDTQPINSVSFWRIDFCLRGNHL